MDASNKQLKVVIGLGQTGVATVRYLCGQGFQVAVMDTRDNPPNLAEIQQQFPTVSVFCGGLDSTILKQADEIIVSPGLATSTGEIAECKQEGIPVIGDIELFARHINTTKSNALICAITGSNAKSTVTTLVAQMAQAANKDVRCGGNIGIPILDLIETKEPDLYVLELSSFQLETTYSLHPTVATILNISPDHMDRYASLNDYIAAKQRIYHGAKNIVYNRDDVQTYLPEKFKLTKQLTFGLTTPENHEFGILEKEQHTYLAQGTEPLINVNEILLQGSHNWMNSLAALALGTVLNLPLQVMLDTLKTFTGLRHRGQWVANINDVQWYNDSKGTNVGASLAAIEGLAAGINGKIILIAGGQGKGADFSELRPAISHHVRHLVLIGEDAAKLENCLQGASAISYANSMQEAVHLAKKHALPGDAVLLSPACASFDMFKNFAERGDVFIRVVEDLK